MRHLTVQNWDYQKQLSTNFKLWEFICSETAYEQKIMLQYVYDKDVEENLQYLCNKLLQPLRDRLNEPICITSGYRCPTLNYAVGGVQNSTHKYGFAADIILPSQTTYAIELISMMTHHELIIHDRYIHLSIKPSMNDNRFSDQRTR